MFQDPLDISTISHLPTNMQKQIDVLRRDISKKFNTQCAFEWNPHITLAVRRILPLKNASDIIEKIKELSKSLSPINIQTEGLDVVNTKSKIFKLPYAIHIKVKPTEELIRANKLINQQIYRDLEISDPKKTKYYPHITLACRDLDKNNFAKAKKYFQKHPIKTNYNFYLDNICLVQHIGDKLKIFKKFQLK